MAVDGGGQPDGGAAPGGAKGGKKQKAPKEPGAFQKGRPMPLHSALFEQCYKGRVVPDDEWPQFMAVLHKDLPVTFRFSSANPLGSALATYMQREFLQQGALAADEVRELDADSDVKASTDGAAGAPVQARPLYPLPGMETAWKLDLPKTVLRKAAGPKRLHCFLKRCTELGAISRQEAVSMVPAVLLRGGPGLRVLDLCASPGMKTLQLLDMTAERPRAEDGASAPTAAAIRDAGAVVSNELDGRRCCMLAHHVLKARNPAGLVIHHNATALPPLGEQFERVLCDVPCSGDGTIRKAPQLLAGWRPNRSSVLHHLQVRIACAGAARLASDGRMVYSTCALSPIENEAVVSALLLRARGALELVDCSEELPDLPRRPGLEHWEVPAGARQCRSAVFLQSPAEAAARGLEVPASAWPPPAGEEASSLGLPSVLRRCWRLYPHLCDSGGFFVAVLQRVSGRQLPDDFLPSPVAVAAEGSTTASPPEEASAENEGAAADELPEEAVCKEELPASQKEACYAAATASERTQKLVEEALDFYGLDGLPADNFFVRNEGEGRNVYLVSDAVRDVLSASSAAGLRALIGGVRVFDENRFLKSSGCKMRLCQEGVQWLAPLMRRRACPATPSEMMRLLEGTKVPFIELSEASPLREALESLQAQGSVAVVCELPCGARLCAAGERGAECLTLFVNQHELRELRETLQEFFCPAAAATAAAAGSGK